MKKPQIGYIPTLMPQEDAALSAYISAIQNAGGEPVCLTYADLSRVEEALAPLSGLLISGGADVAPQLYGEAKRPCCGELSAQRDEMDAVFFRTAYRKGLPILGICRGAQVINALLGGSLYQDLSLEYENHGAVSHSEAEKADTPVHPISLVPGTPLSEIFGADKVAVNSIHHQGIRTLGGPLQPTAYAEDGLVEGAYDPTVPYLLAVQFHPERIGALGGPIFASFVSAARRYDPDRPELFCRQNHYTDVNAVPIFGTGERRTLAWNDAVQICRFLMPKGAVFAPHRHHDHQIGYIAKGHMYFYVEHTDGTREEIDAREGLGYVFRPLESHGGQALEDSIVIEVFCPTREPLTRD